MRHPGSNIDGMRKLDLLFLLVIATTCCAYPSACHADTTETVLSNCRSVARATITHDGVILNETYESGYCMGAFTVVDQMLMAINSATRKPPFSVCLPKGFTRTQVIAVFVRYAEKHPERYGEDFPWVAFDAAKEAFLVPSDDDQVAR
jgi:hypothetical protein